MPGPLGKGVVLTAIVLYSLTHFRASAQAYLRRRVPAVIDRRFRRITTSAGTHAGYPRQGGIDNDNHSRPADDDRRDGAVIDQSGDAGRPPTPALAGDR